MTKRSPGLVFVSHASVDGDCAKLLQGWLHERFPGFINVFVSSDWESIEMGGEWLEAISEAMKRCRVAIVLASENSLDRRWVSFEIGALKLIGKNVIPVCIGSIDVDELPSPLDRQQACRYDNVDDRLDLLRAISVRIGMPEGFTNRIHRAHAEQAPMMLPAKTAPSTESRQSGHGVTLERLFQTADRWTSVVYTCRATFTGETCPGSDPLLGKTISPHIPVDEIQTFCTAVNHFMPVAARKHEDDILRTVICSREAERQALAFPAVLADAAVPSFLDRDLIVIGENNFSNLMLYLAEPFQPWTGRQRDERRHANKLGRSMVYAERTPHSRLDAQHLQMNSVGEGGGMISIFPSPFNFRKTVINLYGCHREGQFTLESWLRGPEVDRVVDLITTARGDEDPRLDSIQIVVNRGGDPSPGHFTDPNPSSGAIPNVREGRPFWLTRLNSFPPSQTIEVNPHCDERKPMYDISLIVELSEETQSHLRKKVQTLIADPELYWEHEHCNIGFHITLYEFCTHDLPSPKLLSDLEANLTILLRMLGDDASIEIPLQRDTQVRGIELTHAALIAYVDFLPVNRWDANWLETVRTWCDATVLRMAKERLDVQLFNKRRVPFPPHVTLCRVRQAATQELARRVDEVTAKSRYAILAPVAIEALSLAVARRRPYQEVEVRRSYDLRKQ